MPIRTSRRAGTPLLLVSAFGLIGLLAITAGCPNVPPDDTDPNIVDPNTGDPNTGDPNAGDPNSGDPNTADPNTADPNSGGGGNGDGDGDGDGGDTDTPAPLTLTLTRIASSGDSVPGQSGATFTRLGEPVVGPTGRIAFWGAYQNGAGNAGIYVLDTDDTLRRVIDDNPATAGVVPGHGSQYYFGNFRQTGDYDPLDHDLIWAAGDRLLFVSRVTGASPPSEGVYRWRASDGDLVRVGNREQVVALFTDALAASFSPTFRLPGVSDAGLGVFSVEYLYFTTTSQLKRGTGIFTSNGTAITIVRDTVHSQANPGDVPDQTNANVRFDALDPLTTISPSGDILFSGEYSRGTGSAGVYLYRSGAAVRVVDDRTGALWPGLPSGTVIGGDAGFETFAIGPLGHIAIETSLTPSGGTARQAVILWDWDAGNWKELTGPSGEPATELLTGVNDDGKAVVRIDGRPYMASRTAVTPMSDTLDADLQGVTIEWEIAGGSINNAGRAVLPYTVGDAPGLAYWTGTEMLVVADARTETPVANIVEITTLADPRRDRPARTGFLNDDDEIAFRLLLSDGTEAVYVARGE